MQTQQKFIDCSQSRCKTESFARNPSVTVKNPALPSSSTCVYSSLSRKDLNHENKEVKRALSWLVNPRPAGQLLTIHYITRLSCHALALTICHVSKLKIHQDVLGSDSPNLMLTKVSRYTVISLFFVSKVD